MTSKTDNALAVEAELLSGPELARQLERLWSESPSLEDLGCWLSNHSSSILAALSPPETGDAAERGLCARCSGVIVPVDALYGGPTPADETVREVDVINDIAAMMAEFVDNWPPHKKLATSLKLIAKTFRAARGDDK